MRVTVIATGFEEGKAKAPGTEGAAKPAQADGLYTQAAQQALLVDCAQRIAGALNVATADPVTVDLPNGAGSVAGYRITLNPM